MSNKTIIKYTVEGCRMHSVPIIKIIPNGDINIKLTFPKIDDININTNNIVVINQEEVEPYPYFNLFANEKVIAKNYGYFNHGTIIITGECKVEETQKMMYDG